MAFITCEDFIKINSLTGCPQKDVSFEGAENLKPTMEQSKNLTCRYCEWLDKNYCPYWITKIKKDVNSISCNQFTILKDVSRFKERKKMDELEVVKKKQAQEIKKSLKRSIQF